MDGWAVVDGRLDLISSHPPIGRIIHTTAMCFGTAVTATVTVTVTATAADTDADTDTGTDTIHVVPRMAHWLP